MQTVLDIVMIALLFATIYFCLRLNKKITSIKSGKAEMQLIVGNLTTVLQQTEKNISELRTLSTNSALEMQKRIVQAREILSDLSIMIASGEKLANKLEDSLILSKNYLNNVVSFENEHAAEETVKNTKAANDDPATAFSKAKFNLMSAIQKFKHRE